MTMMYYTVEGNRSTMYYMVKVVLYPAAVPELSFLPKATALLLNQFLSNVIALLCSLYISLETASHAQP